MVMKKLTKEFPNETMERVTPGFPRDIFDAPKMARFTLLISEGEFRDSSHTLQQVEIKKDYKYYIVKLVVDSL